MISKGVNKTVLNILLEYSRVFLWRPIKSKWHFCRLCMALDHFATPVGGSKSVRESVDPYDPNAVSRCV